MARHWRFGLAATVLKLGLLLSGPAWPDAVPPHLVGLARALLSDVQASDALGDGAAGEDLLDAIRAARLTSWQGALPTASVDTDTLAGALGLDAAIPDHREALAAVLAANDHEGRARAIAQALEVAGREVTVPGIAAARSEVEAALRSATENLQTTAEVDAGDGRTLTIAWDPASGDVQVSVEYGEGRGETVLHGGASGSIDETGTVNWNVSADPAPVTHLSPEFRAKIARTVFGVWTAENGTVWMIRPPGSGTPGEKAGELPAKAREQAELRERIAELRRERVHIWRAPDGGRVIQDEFKDLRGIGDYVYLREESEAHNSDEIARLESRLAELSASAGNDWFNEHDPLGLARPENADRERMPIDITVLDARGYRYRFDQAHFDGRRVTARRILRDDRDIDDLPDWVISGLIADWSPPEWIELEAVYDVRTRSVALNGQRWRLHVTYSATWNEISNIHTPFSRSLNLDWDAGGDDEANEDAAKLFLTTVDGDPVDRIDHEVPFRIEVEYLTDHDFADTAALRINASEGAHEIDLRPVVENGRLSATRFRSPPLYLRSVQFAERPSDGGLYTEDRYYPEASLKGKLEQFVRETENSEKILAGKFSGEWSVTHVEEGEGFVGRAAVSDDGRRADLALVGETGFKRYRSLEIRALPGGEHVEIRFERVLAFTDEEATSAGLKPLLDARIYSVPTLSREASFTLGSDTLTVPVQMEPAPEEVIRVSLAKRAEGRWAGAILGEATTGARATTGRQTWGREPEVRGAIVVEDQLKRDGPGRQYYPYRRPLRSEIPRADDRESAAERAERARIERWASPQVAGSSRRNILVYGHDLPVGYGDAVLIESGVDGITYDYRFLDTASEAALATAWSRAREIDESFSAPEDYDALLLIASFDETVRPGTQTLSLNGVPVSWFLTFADATARAYFIDMPPPRGQPTDLAFGGHELHLEAEIEADIPVEDELVFKLRAKVGSETRLVGDLPMHRVTEIEAGFSSRSEPHARPLYRSPPIHIHLKGDDTARPAANADAVVVSLPQAGNEWADPPENEDAAEGTEADTASDGPPPDLGPASRIENAPDSRYADRDRSPLGSIFATFERPDLLRVARPAVAHVFATPTDIGETIWTGALSRARDCYVDGGKLIRTSNAGEYSRFVIADIFDGRAWSNTVRDMSMMDHIASLLQPGRLFAQAGTRSVNITLGDHAASLLVRDEFVHRSRERRGFYAGLAASLHRREGAAGPHRRFVEEAIARGPESDPFWRVASVEIDGEEVVIGDLLDFDHSTRKGREAAIEDQWHDSVTLGPRTFLDMRIVEAADAFVKSIDDALATTKEKGDCDLEHLMVIATRDVPEIVNAILPRLVRPYDQGDRVWWGPDTDARNRVSSLDGLRAEVQAVDDYADLDKTVAALVVAAATGGTSAVLSYGAGALTTAAYVTLAADVIDVAVFGAYEAYHYADKWGGVDYARGAAAALGTGIYDEALAGEPSALWTAGGILLPGLGALGSLGDLRQLAQIEKGREIAARMGRVDSGALRALNPEEQAALMEYVRTATALRRIADTPGLRGIAAEYGRLDRVQVTDADRAFLARFDAHAKARRLEVEAGWKVAAKLDRIEPSELRKLDDAQRSALGSYLEDIQTRIKTMDEGRVERRLQIVTARERELARLGPDMARLDDAAAALRRAEAARAADEAAAARGRPIDPPAEPADVARREESLPDRRHDGEDGSAGRRRQNEPDPEAPRRHDQADGDDPELARRPPDREEPVSATRRQDDGGDAGRRTSEPDASPRRPRMERPVRDLEPPRRSEGGDGSGRNATPDAESPPESPHADPTLAKRCSFGGETLVLTRSGAVPIRSIRVGDQVYSREERTGATGWRPVLDHYVADYSHVVTIQIRDPDAASVHSIRSNREHPFFVIGPHRPAAARLVSSMGGPVQRHAVTGRWVAAAGLAPGDRLLEATGDASEVAAVMIEAAPLRAYNLEVAEFHSFFVEGPGNGRSVAPVWVHNDCRDALPAGSKRADPPVTQYGQPRYRTPGGDEYYRGWDGRYYRDRTVGDDGVLRPDPNQPPSPPTPGHAASDSVGPPPFTPGGRDVAIRQEHYQDLVDELRIAGLTEDEVAEWILTAERISYETQLYRQALRRTNKESLRRRDVLQNRLQRLVGAQDALKDKIYRLSVERGVRARDGSRFMYENNIERINRLTTELATRSFRTGRLFTGRPPSEFDDFGLSFSRTTEELRESFRQDAILDPNGAGMIPATRPTALDHIWPVQQIVQNSKFRGLTIEQQRAVIHDPELLMKMDVSLNSAKQDLTGVQYRRFLEDRGYDKAYIEYMVRRQEQAEDYATRLIDCLTGGTPLPDCRSSASRAFPRPAYGGIGNPP